MNRQSAIAINFRCPPELYEEMEKIGLESFPTPGKILEFNQGRTLKLLIKAGIEAINSANPSPDSERFAAIESRLKQLEDAVLGDGK